MSTSPNFAGTVLVGCAAVSATADAAYTTPSNSVTVVTAGASGSRISEIDLQGTGTTLACVVTLWLYDGTNYHLADTLVVSAVTPSTTAIPFQSAKVYANLLVPTGWTLKASCTVASQPITVNAYAASF